MLTGSEQVVNERGNVCEPMDFRDIVVTMPATLTRRSLIAAFPGAWLCSMRGGAQQRQAVDGYIDVTHLREPSDIDDTAAFHRAMTATQPIYVPGSQGSGPLGEYLVRELTLASGITIFGDGIGRTIIRPIGSDAVFHCDSGNPLHFIGGITLRDFTLHGHVLKRGFQEHCHLMHLNGVEDLQLENVEFKGFQGDGLHLGSSRVAGTERHNRRVVVSGCIFDGVNNDNRNGISVIDGDVVRVVDCKFLNCARPNMPGAIDFEPNNNHFAIIRNIIISGCSFRSTGGNVATIAFHIPGGVSATPTDIDIRDNEFADYQGSGGEIYINVNKKLHPENSTMNIVIQGNRGKAGNWVYRVHAASGIKAIGNEWSDYKLGSMIGAAGSRQPTANVEISDVFVRCGLVGKVGIFVLDVATLALKNCTMIDCGDGSKNAYAICFAKGESRNVTLANLDIRSPNRLTFVAVIKEQQHKLNPAGNMQVGNNFSGLPAIDITKPNSALAI